MAIEKIAVLRAMRDPEGREAPLRLEVVGGGFGAHASAIVRGRRGASRGDSLSMANIHSQKKRILRAERERLENRRYTSRIKTYFHRLETALASGDAEAAETEHHELVSTIDKAVKRGALHRNTGARKKSQAARLRAGSHS